MWPEWVPTSKERQLVGDTGVWGWMQVEPVSSVMVWVERMWVCYQVKASATAERHRILITRWLLTLRNTV